MTGPISPEDRALIERTRKVNKTLSMFVFALQERSNIPSESQLGIAEILVTLAETVRARAAKNDGAGVLVDGAVAQLQIEAPQGSTESGRSNRQR